MKAIAITLALLLITVIITGGVILNRLSNDNQELLNELEISDTQNADISMANYNPNNLVLLDRKAQSQIKELSIPLTDKYTNLYNGAPLNCTVYLESDILHIKFND